MAGGLELDDLCSPFQPKPFYDSMIKMLELGSKLWTCLGKHIFLLFLKDTGLY